MGRCWFIRKVVEEVSARYRTWADDQKSIRTMSRVAVAVKMDDLAEHDSLIVSIRGQGGELREGVEGG